MSPVRHRVVFALSLAALWLTGVTRSGEPVVVKSGAVVLPISGLALDLPVDPRADFTWNLLASYALSDNGTSFDGRDVIDEKVKDNLVAGSWVQFGYFNAGDCKATVGETELTDAWTDERDLYGLRWCLRGGKFDLGGDIGKVPTVVMCAHREGRKDLLIHRFFLTCPGSPYTRTSSRRWRKQSWSSASLSPGSRTRGRPSNRGNDRRSVTGETSSPCARSNSRKAA